MCVWVNWECVYDCLDVAHVVTTRIVATSGAARCRARVRACVRTSVRLPGRHGVALRVRAYVRTSVRLPGGAVSRSVCARACAQPCVFRGGAASRSTRDRVGPGLRAR